MQLGCFGFHRQIYPQEGDSKKKWKIEIFGKFDMPIFIILFGEITLPTLPKLQLVNVIQLFSLLNT